MLVLKQLLPYLETNKRKLWLLSLVTKQDLWRQQQSEAEFYYRDGEYGVEIQQLLKKVEPRSFRHELHFASLIIGNFMTGANEQLKATCQGYDHRAQVATLRRLFEVLDSLRQWESQS